MQKGVTQSTRYHLLVVFAGGVMPNSCIPFLFRRVGYLLIWWRHWSFFSRFYFVCFSFPKYQKEIICLIFPSMKVIWAAVRKKIYNSRSIYHFVTYSIKLSYYLKQLNKLDSFLWTVKLFALFFISSFFFPL